MANLSTWLVVGPHKHDTERSIARRIRRRLGVAPPEEAGTTVQYVTNQVTNEITNEITMNGGGGAVFYTDPMSIGQPEIAYYKAGQLSSVLPPVGLWGTARARVFTQGAAVDLDLIYRRDGVVLATVPVTAAQIWDGTPGAPVDAPDLGEGPLQLDVEIKAASGAVFVISVSPGAQP